MVEHELRLKNIYTNIMKYAFYVWIDLFLNICIKSIKSHPRWMRRIKGYKLNQSVSSVAQPCLTLCDRVDCSTPGLPVHHQLPEFIQTNVLSWWCHPTISCSCYPLLLPPSIFPSIRVFSNELVLHIRWPKYWSFSCSISHFNKYSGLISFRMDWYKLLSVKQLSYKDIIYSMGIIAIVF